MKHYFRIIFIIAMFPLFSHAKAEYDCPREIPSAIVEQKPGQLRHYSISQKNERYIIERVTLKHGQAFEIHQYGCAHFGLEYRIPVKSGTVHNMLETAEENLRLLSTVIPDFTPDILKSIQDYRKSARKTISGNGKISVTEGYEDIYIQTVKENDKYYLAVIYDIAL